VTEGVMARYRTSETGQIMTLAAISLVMLISFVALAVDVGYFYSVRRKMQTAADAAAVAGANSIGTSNASNYEQAASDVATLNGFQNGQNGVTVTVSEPSLSSPYPSTASYVEVSISQAVPTFFLHALGYSTMNVSTQAIAGSSNPTSCIYALDQSKSEAFYLDGNVTVDASCGITDDSSSGSALTVDGNITVDTSSIGVVGGVSKSGNVSFTPNPVTGIANQADPLSSLAAPSVGSCTQAATTNSGTYSPSGILSSLNIAPAVYSGGMSFSGILSSATFTGGTYGNGISLGGLVTNTTFNPGQYQNGGGTGAAITINGNSSTTFESGSYTFCGPVVLSGNGTVTLQPGLYEGGISITGNSNVTFSAGTYILAGGGLSVTGNSTLSGSGVTFYNTSSSSFAYAPIDLTGNETANLSAPTSGSLQGILFFQDRSVTGSSSNGSSVVGNSSSTFNGVVYFPTTSLSYLGNSSSTGYTFLIADTISIVGNANVSLGSNYSSLSGGSPIKSDALYE